MTAYLWSINVMSQKTSHFTGPLIFSKTSSMLTTMNPVLCITDPLCWESISYKWTTDKGPGGRLNIKMSSYQYRDPHVKEKTISRPLFLTWESPYLGKTVLILRRGPVLQKVCPCHDIIMLTFNLTWMAMHDSVVRLPGMLHASLRGPTAEAQVLCRP